MITFKEYNKISQEIINEQLLVEGKYLNLVKHFLVKLYKIRKLAKQTEDFDNSRYDKQDDGGSDDNVGNNDGETSKREHFVIAMGVDTNFLAEETRGLIANLPKYYQPILKDLVEKISGEPIGEFDPEVAERMFGWNCYKKYFKLYVLNFIIEVLLIESIQNKPNFDKLLEEIANIYKKVDSLVGATSISEGVRQLLSLAPKVVSIVGKLTKLSAQGFE